MAKMKVELKMVPELKRRILRANRKKPHLSMNAFLNEVILEKISEIEAADGARK